MRIFTLLLLLATFCIQPKGTYAQQGKLDSLFIKGDTTAIMDSLMEDFEKFIDSVSAPKSFFSADIGFGNRTFSINNNALNTQSTSNSLSILPSLGYYNKSGLGISISGFAANYKKGMEFYQFAITPSYDYDGDKIAAGVSYTHYFAKDSGIAVSSPYENDLYGYFQLRSKSNWRFGVALGYATGKFNDQLSYRDSVRRFNNVTQRLEWTYFKTTLNSVNKINDFMVSGSVRKDYEWDAVFSKRDNITLNLTGYLVAGLSKINSTTNQRFGSRQIELAKLRPTYTSADGTGFQMQSVALSLGIFYTIGKFSVQPVWYMDYYIPEAEKNFSNVFSVNVGFNF